MLGLGRDNGLVDGKGGFKVSVMAGTPSSVLLAGKFLVIFGGPSVGSIVLTLLMLGPGRGENSSPGARSTASSRLRAPTLRFRPLGLGVLFCEAFGGVALRLHVVLCRVVSSSAS